ncbi:MAG: BREX-1 system phosphatase PglZ type B [Bacteroidia bacterium]|nr:BREX-1 system phosphatase PglZ type B [Bacteroidia bacterium]
MAAQISTLPPDESREKLRKLLLEHKKRLNWVWTELGFAHLVKALPHLLAMAEITTAPFPFSTLEDLKEYYISIGFLADQNMRKALAEVRAERDVEVVRSLIVNLYKPWLQSITEKFQGLVENNYSIFSEPYEGIEEEAFVLFVDAFRFELAKEFAERLDCTKYKLDLKPFWSPIPSVTPTGKPHFSPVAPAIDTSSKSIEFRPQLLNGKDLQTAAFREALEKADFHFIAKSEQIYPEQKNWQEIGEIDKKGHAEQAEVVRRINELLDQVNEAIEEAFLKGIKRILVVTDHGWLLLPGGLPKEEIKKDLTETRWGRCALIKEGAPCSLLHLPWRWNPGTFIAFAPGISFFKKNEEYAHGGISLQECLVPVIVIENLATSMNAAKITDAKWVGLTCRITTIDSQDGFKVDIRTKFNDPSTSILLSPNRSVIENKITLMVDDTAESQSVVVVLIDGSDRIIDKKLTLVGA